MSKREILVTPMGEMMDMLACFSIDQGGAKQKKEELSLYDKLFRVK